MTAASKALAELGDGAKEEVIEGQTEKSTSTLACIPKSINHDSKSKASIGPKSDSFLESSESAS